MKWELMQKIITLHISGCNFCCPILINSEYYLSIYWQQISFPGIYITPFQVMSQSIKVIEYDLSICATIINKFYNKFLDYNINYTIVQKFDSVRLMHHFYM